MRGSYNNFHFIHPLIFIRVAEAYARCDRVRDRVDRGQVVSHRVRVTQRDKQPFALTGNVESPINLEKNPVNCGRKPECPERI